MKISALNNIPTVRNHRNIQNNKTQNKQNEATPPKDFKELINYPKSYRPSFGISETLVAWAIYELVTCGGLYLWFNYANGIVEADKEKDNAINKEENIKETIKKNLKETAAKFEISEAEAMSFRQKALETVKLPVNGNGEEIGLNSVVGFEMEKYKIMNDYIFPIVACQNVPDWYPTDEIEVPNGMLLKDSFARNGKYVMDKTCEHLEELGINILSIKLSESDHEKNADIIEETFEEARELYEEKGIRSVIKFDDEIDSILCDRKTSTATLPEITAFLNNAEDCSSEGVSWIGCTRWPSFIDPAVLRAGRTDIKLDIPEMNYQTVKDTFKYFLISQGQKDANIKFWEISPKTNNDLSDLNPRQIEFIVKNAVQNKGQEELVTTDMIIKEIKKSNSYSDIK